MSDFDGVTFHISTPETKTKILVSIQIRCYQDLVRYGAEQVLQREYAQYVVPPEDGYDFSILVDLENLPAEKGTYIHISIYIFYVFPFPICMHACLPAPTTNAIPASGTCMDG